MSFQSQIDAFATKTKERLHGATRYIVSELASRLDERSPVGNPALWKNPPPPNYRPGTFRGGWQLGVNNVPGGQTGRLDPGGAVTLSAVKAAIPAEAGGNVYYLTNNVIYGPRLENGWSSQAPAGLVGLTALEFPQVVRAAAGGARQ